MRDWMIELRTSKGLTCKMAAKKADCSMRLIELLEYYDHITHPRIAARIAAVYGMDVDGYNRLIHEHHHAETLPEPKPIPSDKDWCGFVRKMRNIK